MPQDISVQPSYYSESLSFCDFSQFEFHVKSSYLSAFCIESKTLITITTPPLIHGVRSIVQSIMLENLHRKLVSSLRCESYTQDLVPKTDLPQKASPTSTMAPRRQEKARRQKKKG